MRLKTVVDRAACRASSPSAATSPQKKAAEEALRLREEQYRAIFEASSDAFLLWDANHDVVDANPAFLQLYGYTREQLRMPGGYPTEFPAEYVAERRSRIDARSPARNRAARRSRCDPTARSFDADLRIIPVRYRGKPHVLTVVRDITERRVSASASCSAARRVCEPPSRPRSTASSGWTAKAASSSSTRPPSACSAIAARQCSAGCSPT